jgi:hypothetical protein
LSPTESVLGTFSVLGGKMSRRISARLHITHAFSASFRALTVAPRLPSQVDATMLRTTTLLIVMVLASGPASALACELWCSGPAATDHRRAAGCHDASRATPAGQQVAPAGGCHDAVVTAPFLTEARQAESESAATRPAVPQLGSMAPDIDRIASGWSVFQVQRPRGPSLQTVLRI